MNYDINLDNLFIYINKLVQNIAGFSQCYRLNMTRNLWFDFQGNTMKKNIRLCYW